MEEKPRHVRKAIITGNQVAIDNMASSGGKKSAENRIIRNEIDWLINEIKSLELQLNQTVNQNVLLTEEGDVDYHDNPAEIVKVAGNRKREITERIQDLRVRLGRYKYGYFEGDNK